MKRGACYIVREESTQVWCHLKVSVGVKGPIQKLEGRVLGIYIRLSIIAKGEFLFSLRRGKKKDPSPICCGHNLASGIKSRLKKSGECFECF